MYIYIYTYIYIYICKASNANPIASDRTTVYTRTATQLRLASPARTTRTARTKRKRRRNQADLPVTGGRTSRTSSPKPPIYKYIYICTCIYVYMAVSLLCCLAFPALCFGEHSIYEWHCVRFFRNPRERKRVFWFGLIGYSTVVVAPCGGLAIVVASPYCMYVGMYSMYSMSIQYVQYVQ